MSRAKGRSKDDDKAASKAARKARKRRAAGGAPMRRELVARLLARRGDALVVPGLGSSAWDVAAAGDHPLNFYTWGAMGGAAMIGLGLAIAQPERRVLVVTGDGEMLMGLGGLATIAVQRPTNLGILVLDNEHYGETGRQKTHTHHGVDIAGMAAAAGFADTMLVAAGDDADAALDLVLDAPGPVIACVKVAMSDDPLVLPERDGPRLKDRFRQALLGAVA